MQQVAALNIDISSKAAPAASVESTSGGSAQAFDSMLQQHQGSANEQQKPSSHAPLVEAKPVQIKQGVKDKDKYIAEPVKPEPTRAQPEKSDSALSIENKSKQSTETDSGLEKQLTFDDADTKADEVVASEIKLERDSSDTGIDWLALIAQADGQNLDTTNANLDSKQVAEELDAQDLKALVDLLHKWSEQSEKGQQATSELDSQLAELYRKLVDNPQNTEEQQVSLNKSISDEFAIDLESEGELNAEEQANIQLLAELVKAEQQPERVEGQVGELKVTRLQPELVEQQAEVEDQETALFESKFSQFQTSNKTEQAEATFSDKPLDVGIDNISNEGDAAEIAIENQPVTLSDTKADKADSALTILANLPESKLDKALTELAARLAELEGGDPSKQLDAEMKQLANINSQANTVLASNLTSVNKSISENTDFINSLKAGIAEYKQQLQQGHQPAIDLSALVADAMQTSGQFSQVSPEQLAQQLRPFNQVVELSQSINNSLDLATTELGRKDAATVSEISRTEVKTSTQQPLFDKAINITKPEGHQHLAERVRWMVGNNLMQADIRLDPPDMGAMQIKVSMQGESASISFVVQSPQAREMLDQAVPRLRELLGEKGIELGESHVRQQNQSNGDQEQQSKEGQLADAEAEVKDEHLLAEQEISNGHLGGIDYFV